MLKLEARLLKHTDKTSSENGCWLWTASKHKRGYGQIRISGKMYRAHRVSWMLFKGEIPESQIVRHACDNPSCVNPNHLEIGTNQDNMDDRERRGRTAKGDKNGARVHPECLARGEKHGSKIHPEKIFRGEKVTNAKLIEEQVKEIRYLYREKIMTIQELAIKFNVSRKCIYSILKYRTWKHV